MTARGRLGEAGPEVRHPEPARPTGRETGGQGRTPPETPGGPVRTCVGCRARGPRSALLRVVAVAAETGEPVLVVDEARRMPGRGAWLHPDPGCLELAVRRRAFGRALRLQASPAADAVARYLGAAGSSESQQQ